MGAAYDILSEPMKVIDFINRIGNMRLPNDRQIKGLEDRLGRFRTSWAVNIDGIITEMVRSVNKVTADLKTLANSPQTVNTSLKALANNIGMGAHKQWEIKNQHFDVKFNINITIEADELENVLLSRHDSRLAVRAHFEREDDYGGNQ